jgi:hypothetical protein
MENKSLTGDRRKAAESKKKKARKPATAAQAAAGRANLIRFKKTGVPPNLTHGVKSVIKTGEIPPQIPDAKQVADEVDAIIAAMVADLGGPTEITAQVQVILEAQRLCLLVLKLSGRYLSAQGILKGRSGRPHPLLSTMVSWANAARLNSVALGLGRRARKVGPTSIDEYLETRGVSSPPDHSEPTVNKP